MQYTVKDLIRAAKKGDIELAQKCLDNKVDINMKGNWLDAPALHYAIFHKQEAMVQWLLKHSASIDYTNIGNQSPVQRAVFTATPSIVRLLTKHGAKFEQPCFEAAYFGSLENDGQVNFFTKDSIGSTLAHYAAANGQIQVLKIAQKAGVILIRKNILGNTALMCAVDNGQVDAMSWLLDNCTSLSEKDYNGHTALLRAAGNDQVDAMSWLLKNGASLTEKNNYGSTALLCAAKNGHVDAMSWLLENGASLSERNDDGYTALLCAAYSGHVDAMSWLLENGASLSEKDNKSNTSLLLAACDGHMDAMSWLLENGVSLGEKNNNGGTALLCAADNGHTDAMSWLFKNGASLSEKNNDGNTALLLAASNGHMDAMSWLLENGASLSEKNNNGNTALLCAANNGHTDLILWLLENGTDINAQNYFGETALYMCAEDGRDDMAAYLVAMGADVNLRLTATTSGGALSTAGSALIKGISALAGTDSALGVAKDNGYNKIVCTIGYAKERENNWKKYKNGANDKRDKWDTAGASDSNPLYLAALGGHPNAQRTYAICCFKNGDGESAVKFFGFAHYQGADTADSYYQLAEIYAKGLGGVTMDFELAAVNYQRAVGLDHPNAANELSCLQPQLREHRLGALLTVIKSTQDRRATQFLERQQALHKSIAGIQSQVAMQAELAGLLMRTWAHIFALDKLSSKDDSLFMSCRKLKPAQLSTPMLLLNFGYWTTYSRGIANWQQQKQFCQIKPYDKCARRLNETIKGLESDINRLGDTRDAYHAKQAAEGLIACYRDYRELLCSASSTAQQVFLMQEQTIIISGRFGAACLNSVATKTLAPRIVRKSASQEHGTAAVYGLNGAHFKHKPHAPGVEFMVSSLGHLIAGQGATPTELLKVINEAGNTYIYQAAQTVVGQELETILKHNPDCVAKIKPENFSAVSILGFLINPQDGKADNYMVEFTVDDKNSIKEIEIIGIDNDLAFAELAVVREKALVSNGPVQDLHFANVKNVLCFFPQMYEPVNAAFREKFLKQVPEQILLQWLLGIHEQNQRYTGLLKSGVFTQEEFSGGKTTKRGLQLPIKLVPGTLKKVYRKLLRLQDDMSNNPNITLWELLENIEPELARHYQDVKTRVDMNNDKDSQDDKLINDYARQVDNIMEYVKDLYYEHITDWDELKHFRAQVEAGNRGIMTERVLKTNYDFEFEDARTQLAPEMLLELVEDIQYDRFKDKDTAALFYNELDKMCLDIRQKPLWFWALQIPLPKLSLWLLKHRLVDVNMPNDRGYTPLHFAAGQGNLALVKALVNQGANMDAQNQTDETPLALVQRRIQASGNNSLKQDQQSVADYIKLLQSRNLDDPIINNKKPAAYSPSLKLSADELFKIHGDNDESLSNWRAQLNCLKRYPNSDLPEVRGALSYFKQVASDCGKTHPVIASKINTFICQVELKSGEKQLVESGWVSASSQSQNCMIGRFASHRRQ